MPKLRVAMISTWPGSDSSTSGGVAGYTRGLADMLAPNSEVTVLADTGASANGSACAVVPTWNPGMLTASMLHRALRELDPDVVHVQHELFLYGSVPSAVAFPSWLHSIARLRPTVVTVHGVVSGDQMDRVLLRGRVPRPLTPLAQSIVRAIFRGIARSPAMKVVHGPALATRLIEYGAQESDIAIAPIAAPSLSGIPGRNASREEARTHLGIPADARVVLSWGFLNTYKGFDELLSGFEKFRARHPDAMLILGAGVHPKLRSDARYLHEHAALVQRARRSDGVRYVGFIPVSQLSDYVIAADVAVFAYTHYVAASGPAADSAALGAPVLLSSAFEDAPPILTFTPHPDEIARKLEDFFASPKVFADETARLTSDASKERIRRSHEAIYARAIDRFFGRA
ncbi:MAG TPA: glycosyltransferase [Candidatus Tyrphobacter sp.]